MTLKMAAVVAVLAALGVAAGSPRAARAVHEVYYRYTVVGYVMDDRGRPVEQASVRVVREKTGLGYDARTDADGLYIVVTRLADESVGESLTLEAAGVRTGLTVRFDPGNRADERGTRVDLEWGTWRERPAAFPATLARIAGRRH